MPLPYKVLAFDVFGTVVDWHTSVAACVDSLHLQVDSNEFALAWRAGYAPALQQANAAHRWTPLDVLHRRILEQLIERFRITGLSEEHKAELNLIWQRLDPWPDSVAGLTRLKRRFKVCTLSNGTELMLTAMAQHAGLPWDAIFGGDTFHRYKPDPATYLGVASTFDLQPGEVMMVAAHANDLEAARSCGLASAYIERPFEFGFRRTKDVSPQAGNSFHATSIVDLADQLDC